MGCIGMPKGDLGNEQNSVTIGDMTGPYKRSKFLEAEQVALEFAAQGFPVVVVNPTAPVGDHDFVNPSVYRGKLSWILYAARCPPTSIRD